jgi:hypothetical protein
MPAIGLISNPIEKTTVEFDSVRNSLEDGILIIFNNS